MVKLKLATVVGTRPEIIRLSEIIKKADIFFNHILIHTGQNYDYELNEIFFSDFELRKPDYFLSVAGQHLGETIGNVISRSYEIFSNEKHWTTFYYRFSAWIFRTVDKNRPIPT